jgi:hypothetical protein
MAVTTTSSTVSYAGNGSAHSFTVPFKFFAHGDLVVTTTTSGVVSTKTLGVDYTVAGAGSDSGGGITFTGAAPAVGTTVTIARSTSPTQSTSFSTAGSFSPKAHENALDRVTMVGQETVTRTAAIETRATALEGRATSLESRATTDESRISTLETAPATLSTLTLYNKLVDPNVYDVRDFGTGVGTGNSTQDTIALLAGIAAISCNPDGTSPKPGVLRLPAGKTLLLEQTLEWYGNVGTASTLIGWNGRSKGPDGATIEWRGPAKGKMLHLQGVNGSLISNICLNARPGTGGNNLARFCLHAEWNRAANIGSSDTRFEQCSYTGFGYYGAGVAAGDFAKSTLSLTGVTGTFQVGEYILDTTKDGIATVETWNGTNTLGAMDLVGTSFTTPGTTIQGLTSGATATVASVATVAGYGGNHQFSEAVWVQPLFQGTELFDAVHAGWAGWLAAGSANNKNYELHSPKFDGTRYGIDGGTSGYLNVFAMTGGNIGASGKGWFGRFGPGNVEVYNGNFENGNASCKSGIFYLTGGSLTVHGGDYFGLNPPDNYAIKNSGVMTLVAPRFGADVGVANIQNTGSLLLLGVGWREALSGYLPIYDSSGNTVGLNGDADYSRGASNNVVAIGCTANNAGTSTTLPDLYMKALSPAWNQLWDNGLTANYTIVRRGTLSCSDEARTVTYSNVKTVGTGKVQIATAPPKSKIRGIVLDLTQTFGGGSLSAVTMSVGTTSNHTKFMGATDVHTAIGQFESGVAIIPAWDGTDEISLWFIFTGATITALTQGSVTIHVQMEKFG